MTNIDILDGDRELHPEVYRLVQLLSIFINARDCLVTENGLCFMRAGEVLAQLDLEVNMVDILTVLSVPALGVMYDLAMMWSKTGMYKKED